MLKYLVAFARHLLGWPPKTKPEHEDLQMELTIESTIELCQRQGKYVSVPFRNGDVYAYPHKSGGTAWGVNGGEHGHCIIQGIRGGPQGNGRWRTGNR